MLSFSDHYVLLATAASFIFGYQLAAFNTSFPFFVLSLKACGNSYTYTCDAANFLESITTPIVFIGAALGSLAAGRLLPIGRRFSLFVTHLCSVLGALLCCFAPTFTLLIIGRAIGGLCVGLATVVPPTIINEMCSHKIRGSRGVLHQFGITFGIFAAICFGLFLGAPPDELDPTYELSSFQRLFLRFMQMLPGLVSLTVLALMVLVYTSDTPLSLLEHGKSKQAMTVLQKIYESPEIAEEHFEKLSQDLSDRMEAKGSARTAGILEILRSRLNLRLLLIGCLLSIGQQTGGINVFVSMSTKLFHALGLPRASANIASAVVGGINMLMTFPALLVIDSLGRKPLLLIGTVGQSLFLMIVPCMHMVGANAQLPIGSVVSVVGYIIFFALAQGPVLWVYLFEMYPTEVKGICTGIASSLNWIAAFAVVSITAGQAEATAGTFVFFAATCIASALFILLFVKETKGCVRSPYLPADLIEESERRPLTESP